MRASERKIGNNGRIYLGSPLKVPDEAGISIQKRAKNRYALETFFFQPTKSSKQPKRNEVTSSSATDHSNCCGESEKRIFP
jgi:hypothetical protein